MPRKNTKLAWIENGKSRVQSLKKRRLTLLKKVKELTKLCNVRACIIMFSPNESEPMVWPSIDMARLLLQKFFAIPCFERKKKEANLQQYLQEETQKIQEKLMRSQTEMLVYLTDQLMLQLQQGHRIADLNMSEIYALLHYLKFQIMLLRTRLEFMPHPPLRDLPLPPFQSKEFGTMINDILAGSIRNNERSKKTDEFGTRMNLEDFNDDKSYYLFDQWVFPSEPPKPSIFQQNRTEMVSYNENQNPRSYFACRGSGSNGNPNLEMEPIRLQGITFNDLGGSVSQPLQHYNINNNPVMGTSQQRQYSFDFMSCDLGVPEEGSNINHGDS